MRRTLIQTILPSVFCMLPTLAAVLVAVAIPGEAMRGYLARATAIDWLILALGGALFVTQTMLSFKALQWRGNCFDERPDRWLTHLAQAAEWFPLLGLIGTVAAILQTFGSFGQGLAPEAKQIIASYAPAITATGSGLFMALINILPTWVVLMGREMIRSLAGSDANMTGGPT